MEKVPERLSPCPFCGGAARDRRKAKGAYLDVYIQCRDCKAKSGAAQGDLKTPYSELLIVATRKWNRRMPREVRCGG